MEYGILMAADSEVDFMIHGLFSYQFFGQTVWITTSHVCILLVMLLLLAFAVAANRQIKQMKTKCVSAEELITALSGGNQQKVIIGKWLERQPDVFLMDEPTRGIDVGAKYEIYQLIIQMAKEGKTIVVVSSEMPEILGITNRIAVMSNHRLAGIVNTKDTDQEELMRLSAKYL